MKQLFNHKDKRNSGANELALVDGMIPVVYDTTKNSWVIADYYDPTSPYAGYDYQNKKWANAIMVTSATRQTYMNASPGTSVLEADILAYYVWIPRYRYQLFNASFLTTNPQTISIAFESIGATKSMGTTNGTGLDHPAFTFGDQELTGFWIGKFEVSSDVACVAANYSAVGEGCNLTTKNPHIKPGVTSWVGAMVSTYYLSMANMVSTNYLTREGVNKADVHVLKNMEWGAVAYLSHSISGKNSEITANDNGSHYTGGGLETAYITNIGQTTTGNITGGGYHNNSYSGFSGVRIGETHSRFYVSSSTGVPSPISKYYNSYAYSNPIDSNNRSILGDALEETQYWYYSDYQFVALQTLSGFVLISGQPANYSWFIRGGSYSSSDNASIFNYKSFYGSANIEYSTRISLSVK